MNETYVTRGEIISMLKCWQTGERTTRQLWVWASHRYQAGAVEVDDWDGAASVAHEMLGVLDSLDMHLMLVEDVPLHLAFLETPIGAFDEGLRRWQDGRAAIDYEGRKRLLRDDPIYSLFCD